MIQEDILHPDGPSSLTRRAFLSTSILGLTGVALASCTNGIVERNDIEITQRTFEIPNLPTAWEGKKVTFLSDIHSGPFMDVDDLKRVVKITNDLKSDVVLIPGDFVTSHINEMPPLLEAISELHAPLGVYACTGNHDYYAGVDSVSRGIEDSPIELLRNSNVKIEADGQPLYLLGVDDDDAAGVEKYVEGKTAHHIEAAYKGIPNNAATILMCHKPYHFEAFARTNVGLMLSGHTHGGQIVLGRFGGTTLTFCSLASKYVDGIYLPQESKSQTQMYVSRGIGVVGLPIRINCPAEITQITLAAKRV